ncbi:hypothetical protein U1Q18_049689 [Sarracenia purpurea var. burkii]
MYLATAQPKLLPELRVAKVRLGNCQTMKRANTCGGDSSAGMYLVPINLYRSRFNRAPSEMYAFLRNIFRINGFLQGAFYPQYPGSVPARLPNTPTRRTVAKKPERRSWVARRIIHMPEVLARVVAERFFLDFRIEFANSLGDAVHFFSSIRRIILLALPGD